MGSASASQHWGKAPKGWFLWGNLCSPAKIPAGFSAWRRRDVPPPHTLSNFISSSGVLAALWAGDGVFELGVVGIPAEVLEKEQQGRL